MEKPVTGRYLLWLAVRRRRTIYTACYKNQKELICGQEEQKGHTTTHHVMKRNRS